MIFSTLSLLAITLYLSATVFQIREISLGTDFKMMVRTLGAASILCHFFLAFLAIIHPSGYNLGLFSMLSVMALSIVSIVMVSSFRRPVSNLFVFVFPIAATIILLDLIFTSDYSPRNQIDGSMIGHIILSVIAYSLLTIASVQAALLSFGDSMLRNRQLRLLKNLPPLETMEQLMFEMLWAGLLFLTLSIISGFIYIEDFSGPGVIHHTVLAIAAWIVFSMLAIGRRKLGWRGVIASRWTVLGFLLLALGYFGSKFVIELVIK